MALITVTASRVRVVETILQSTKPAAATITRGQVCRVDSNGKWALSLTTSLANAGNIRGIALKDVIAGEPLTCLIWGKVDIGDGLTAVAFDAPVYGNDTGGSLGDAAGTASVINGYVTSAWAATSADKLLLFKGV